MLKRTAVIMLSLAMCLTLIPVTTYAKTFPDVPESHSAYKAIDYLTDRGIFEGYPDGFFHPDGLLTRAEMATLMCITMGIALPRKTPSVPIVDISASDRHYNHVNHAVAEGWMLIDASGRFHPNDYLTQQETALAAAHIYRTFDPSVDYSSYIQDFIDKDAISSGYASAIGFLIYIGHVSGYLIWSFAPDQPVTLSVIAIVLHRALTVDTTNSCSVILTVRKDSLPWADHGKNFNMFFGINDVNGTRTGAVSGSTVTFSDIPAYSTCVITDQVTSEQISFNLDDSDARVAMDYCTVVFKAIHAGDATNADIVARYGWSREVIDSGAVVLSGESLILTASGSGANLYSFSWNDANRTTAPILIIGDLSAAINYTCTVTGDKSRRVTNIEIKSQPDLLTYTIYGGESYRRFQIEGLKLELTIGNSATNALMTRAVTVEDFNIYGIVVSIDDTPFEDYYDLITYIQHNKPITFTAGTVTAATDPITVQHAFLYYTNLFYPGYNYSQPTPTDLVMTGADYTIMENMFDAPVEYEFEGWQSTRGVDYKPGEIVRDVTSGMVLYTRWRSISSSPPDWDNPYKDVSDDDWFYEDVRFATENGLMLGSGDLFIPDGNLTRGMMATILYRLAGAPDVSDLDNPFGDVPEGPDYYYADAVKWAASNKIVYGSDGMFRPTDNITRQDFCVILARYAEYAGAQLPETREAAVFSDDANIADYAKDAVELLFKAGIINGKPNNIFDPKGNATRAEAAAMLHRYIVATPKPEETAVP